ncbi:NAD-aldehyde dehydrogenase [Limtongia smithiae]|uniref:NAD-aldehyde dehydrogenase n=1 Tax=Limtongia smithiae TaxID=1125753 RepID=UPI0034CE7F18
MTTTTTPAAKSPSAYVETAVANIPDIHASIVSTFRSHKTLPIDYRLDQLRKLYYAILDHKQALFDALFADLHKPQTEAFFGDIAPTLADIVYVMENLKAWAKPQVQSSSVAVAAMNPTIRSDPLGTVLIISPFNYPILLSIGPLIGAIAAGNTAIVKASELSRATTAVLAEIIGCLDPAAYRIIIGALPQVLALQELKFDLIFYTGSGRVGRQVALNAAKTLTPVILELGGKCPAFLLDESNFKVGVKRILSGRFQGAGQTCTSPDYVLLKRELADKFVAMTKEVLNEFFPVMNENTEFTHLVNDAAFERVYRLIQNTRGTIIAGGADDCVRAAKFIPPTVIMDVKPDDSSMAEEIFGPVLPVMLIDTVDEGIDYVNTYHDTPLALYVFSKDSTTQQYVLNCTRSGGVMINSTVIHVGVPYVPFGGVGESGMGSYHGKFSFDAFSHKRAVLSQPAWTDFFTSFRYPPATSFKMRLIDQATPWAAYFPRTGSIPSTFVGKLMFRLGKVKFSALVATTAALVLTVFGNKVKRR